MRGGIKSITNTLIRSFKHHTLHVVFLPALRYIFLFFTLLRFVKNKKDAAPIGARVNILTLHIKKNVLKFSRRFFYLVGNNPLSSASTLVIIDPKSSLFSTKSKESASIINNLPLS